MHSQIDNSENTHNYSQIIYKRNNDILWDKVENLFPKKNTNSVLSPISVEVPESNICSKCNHLTASDEYGSVICTNLQCGIIEPHLIDGGAEWRYYGGTDDTCKTDPSRCGMPINPYLVESSMGIKINCKSGTSYEMHRAARYSNWQAMPYNEKALYGTFQYITLVAQNACLPKILINSAIKYYVLISEYKQSFRGTNREGLLIGAVAEACKKHGCPRTPRELAEIFSTTSAVATHGCKNAQFIINSLEQNLSTGDKTLIQHTDPAPFVDRYCNKLDFPSDLSKLSQFISQKITQNNLMPENTPHSVAAGIVLFVINICNLPISKKQVNIATGISEMTVNKCYKKIDKMRDSLVPSVFIKKYNIQT